MQLYEINFDKELSLIFISGWSTICIIFNPLRHLILLSESEYNNPSLRVGIFYSMIEQKGSNTSLTFLKTSLQLVQLDLHT